MSGGVGAPLGGRWELVLEDGSRRGRVDRLPRGTPFGYHRLEPLDRGGEPRMLIVAPARCRPPDRRRAGVAVQLYAARSQDSWGIGDLASATSLGRWARANGADFLLLNPLHAPAPAPHQQPSPYSPASRRFLSPLVLRVAALPGASELGADLEPLGRAAADLGRNRLIDRDAVWRLVLAAAERCHAATEAGRARPELDTWIDGQGTSLRRFALWCALVEIHGGSWRRWPARLRSPGPGVLRRLEAEHAPRMRLHMWLQWQIDRQLAATSREVDLVHDLAVGCDPDGADTWIDQGVYTEGMRIGAPPDLFNRAGQDWGLPPFDPWRLREADYGPFVETIRAGLRHAAGLRIDHVMGLMRLWWVPQGLGPAAGGYVRYPSADLLAIVALEAHRAGAFVVGEDLGTVDPSIRTELRRGGVLSYRLVMFERRTPDRFPRLALAAPTTHDLPTLAGVWSGADAAVLAAMGRELDAAAVASIRDRFLRIPGVRPRSGTAAVVDRVHAALATSPSLLAVATLDDLLLVKERPNHPGTIDEWPNWRLPLPQTVEEITADPVVTRRLRRLRRR